MADLAPDDVAVKVDLEQDIIGAPADDVPLTDPEEKSRAEQVMSKLGGEIPVLFLSSICVMVRAADVCQDSKNCKGKNGFAVAAGTVSLVVCLVYLLLKKFKAEAIPVQTLTFLSAGLFLWWAVAAPYLTFEGPFLGLREANGYIATWLSLIVSTKLLIGNVTQAKVIFGKVTNKMTADAAGAAFALLVASVVVLLSTVHYAHNRELFEQSDLDGEEIFSFIVSSLSIVICLVMIFLGHKIPPSKLKIVGATVTIMWIAACSVLTFFGPFISADNGYFGCIASLLCAMYLFNAYSAAGEANV